MKERKKKILAILVFVFGILCLLHIYFNNPSEVPFVPCYFRELTGIDCPGCGTTRAIYCLMHFKIWDAIKFNALFVFSIPVVIYLIIRKLLDNKFTVSIFFLYCYLIIMLIFVIVRNIV